MFGSTTLKYLSIIGGAVVFSGFAGWVGVKHVSVSGAEEKANAIIEEAYKKHSPRSQDEKVIAITREVFRKFEHVNPWIDPLLRVGPYLIHRYLPGFMRFPRGVIETHAERGLCNHAANMLSFVLRQEGFESVQWNMVTNTAAHSALLVKMPDEREVLVDPFLG